MSTLQTAATSPPARTARVHRVEVRPRTPAGDSPSEPSSDPRGHAALRDALSLGLDGPPSHVASTSVYLIEGDLSEDDINRIASELLADPVTETAIIGATPAAADALIEVHPLPGVMDPDAQPIELAINAMLGRDVRVQTGRRYDLTGADAATAQIIAQRVLANPVIHAIHTTPFHPDEFPRGHEHAMEVRSIPLCHLDDAALERLSREAHLFLSLEEMQAIQQEYRTLGREPREIELETLAQTWSEHCVHKTLKARIRYREGRAGVSPDEPLVADPLPRNAGESRGGGAFPINFSDRPGHTINDDGSVTIDNLLKSTVAAATHELIADGIDWCLSIFHDNSGVIAFDDETAVCFKVETHNHPSAIEPYGGAATGIGGCIRDIIGTGLAAKPIAATDVFCVATPDIASVPAGCLHPRRILKQVVAGVRDYGNRMGIPTLNGTVWFDDNYVGNPLVYCGCVGVMPRDRVDGEAKAGDHIIALGGRTGRDGIHGATFSSAELTDTHVDEFSHAVQIGNPVTEKKVLDAILAARDFERTGSNLKDLAAELDPIEVDPEIESSIEEQLASIQIFQYVRVAIEHVNPVGYRHIVVTSDGRMFFVDSARREPPVEWPKGIDVYAQSMPAVSRWRNSLKKVRQPLFSGITDCGAGGFSSAVGEMGEKLGATVHLERAPLKYAGLTPTEIWISEAQERMVMSVPEANLDALQRICDLHNVEMCDLGTFGTPDRDLILLHEGAEYGRLPMEFLHEGLPGTMREAEWDGGRHRGIEAARPQDSDVRESLLALLSHPNIASKHWIIRQYDHEVQGSTVLKPLVGERGDGPGDAAVIQPVETSTRGLAIGNGLATGLQNDPYLMALAAIDECVRNIVCVGGDPSRIAILDNFCWPSCADPANLGSLVRAAEGCYDGAKAYRTPFISGKDSLNNQFRTDDGRTIAVPPTLLISGFGIVPDVRQCVTMDAKRAGNLLVIVGETIGAMGGSHYEMIHGGRGDLPVVDLQSGPRHAAAIHRLIAHGLVRSAHDCSEGGVLVAAAEMAMAGRLGLHLDLTQLPGGSSIDHAIACFAETPSRYLLEVHRDDLDLVDRALAGLPHTIIGEFNDSIRLTLKQESLSVSIDDLVTAWRGTLDW